jgi:hypothetical protein
MDFLCIADAARELDVQPHRLSVLLYNLGSEADKLAPIVARRRLVPKTNLPRLRQLVAEMKARARQPVS